MGRARVIFLHEVREGAAGPILWRAGCETGRAARKRPSRPRPGWFYYLHDVLEALEKGERGRRRSARQLIRRSAAFFRPPPRVKSPVKQGGAPSPLLKRLASVHPDEMTAREALIAASSQIPRLKRKKKKKKKDGAEGPAGETLTGFEDTPTAPAAPAVMQQETLGHDLQGSRPPWCRARAPRTSLHGFADRTGRPLPGRSA